MANSRSGDSMIDRVVRVLETFDSGRPRQSPSDIARRADLPMSTAHRLVGELVTSGLLDRSDDGMLQIGMRLWELTTRGSRALGLRQVAMPFMSEVQNAVRQHTQLAVRDGDEALFLERLSHPEAGANITRIAGRLPLHASSSGLVLLAHAPADDIDRVLRGPLPAVSPETVTDPAELRRRLSAIRRQGYVVAPGSIESVSTGIAVPIHDRAGGTLAALSAIVPREHPDPLGVVAVLRRAADGIAETVRAQPSHYR